MKHFINILLFIFCSISLRLSLNAQSMKSFFLIMRNTGEYTLWDGNKIRTFGFAENIVSHPLIPGPTIEVNEGDTVKIGAMNFSQGAPHTIHLHGLDVNQENDGVPHLSFAIEHMDTGYYTFIAKHAGNYLYHCHVSSTLHVQMGMYGKIIVKDKHNSKRAWTNGPEYNSEYAWMTSEFDTLWHSDSVLNMDIDHFDSTGHSEIPIPNYNPQYFLINGKSQTQLYDDDIKLQFKANESIYLRLFNIGFLYNEYVFPSILNAKLISSDGRPINNPEYIDTIIAFPGERFGVMLSGSEEDSGLIELRYRNMNTDSIINSQWIPYNIRYFASTTEKLIKTNYAYPNPSKGNININLGYQIEKSRLKEVFIFNIHGQRIFPQIHIDSNKIVIDLSNYKNGNYLIVVDNKSFISSIMR